MNISGKIFSIMEEKNISRKEFSEKTGIALSSISDWKRKGTNPAAEKLMLIAEVLDVSVVELLSGNSAYNERSNAAKTYVVDGESEIGYVIQSYQSMDEKLRNRLLGYVQALNEIIKNK